MMKNIFTMMALALTLAMGNVSQGGLVAHWTLDDNADNPTVLSEIDATQDGTFQDAGGDPNTNTQSVPGIIGGAFDFDGVDDYVVTGYEGILGNADRSVSFWVNGGANQNSRPHLVSWGPGTGSNHPQERFAIRAEGGVVRVEVNAGGFNGGISILDNTWNNVVVTYDGTGDMANSGTASIYVNGVLDVTASLIVNTTATPSHDATLDASVTIGATEAFGTAGVPDLVNIYQGLIDDVRIYDMVLTQSQIDDLQIPEPASFALAAFGLISVAACRRRR